MSYPLQSLSLPFDGDLFAFFAPLAHQPWAMLLESGGSEHVDSRYHLICADPLATLTTQGEMTRIDRRGEITTSSEDPLALVAQWQAQLLGTLDDVPTGWPFSGGAMGLFGYDLGRRFERLPVQAEADLQLPQMAVGVYDWAWVLDPHQGVAHLLVRGSQADLQRRLAWWQAQQVLPQPACKLTGPWQANLSQAEYAERFARVQAYLQAGDCYQINLTQRFDAPYAGDEWQAYQVLSRVNRAPFSAFLRLADAAVLSLSPERFLRLEGSQVQTKPIKGTLPRHADPDLDSQAAATLRHSPKDRAENLMIVDLLRNDIGRVCVPGSVAVPSLFAIESFPAVHHLVSTVTGTLMAGLSGLDLLRACFPGGSITGAPKIRAMEIIEELEPQRRNLYCGSIGYHSQDGRLDTSICIRTLVAEAGRLHVWAGGGIVADSQVESEYAELFHKLGKILPVLWP